MPTTESPVQPSRAAYVSEMFRAARCARIAARYARTPKERLRAESLARLAERVARRVLTETPE